MSSGFENPEAGLASSPGSAATASAGRERNDCGGRSLDPKRSRRAAACNGRWVSGVRKRTPARWTGSRLRRDEPQERCRREFGPAWPTSARRGVPVMPVAEHRLNMERRCMTGNEAATAFPGRIGWPGRVSHAKFRRGFISPGQPANQAGAPDKDEYRGGMVRRLAAPDNATAAASAEGERNLKRGVWPDLPGGGDGSPSE